MKMKMMILIMLIGGFVVLVACCKTLFPDEKLTMQKKPYTGNELRTDGYYYHFVKGYNRTVVYFLYRNGIILWGGTYSTINIDEIETEMIKLYSEIKKTKDSWGVFIVNGDTIQYEKWVGSATSRPNTYRYICWGKIENDTTIRFTKEYVSERDETRSIDKVWHFKQFDNKPDSTNNFIK